MQPQESQQDVSSIVDNVIVKFKEFINSNYQLYSRNAWIYDDNDIIDVYIRATYRFANGKRYSCLDIATISVDKKYQSRGIASSLINKLIEENPFEMAFVENVLNEQFRTWFDKGDWVCLEIEPPCYYKLKQNEELQS